MLVCCAQGDFHHWVALFNHFDVLFDELLKPRADLALRYDQAEAKTDPPFPSSTVVAVLRVTATILENCSNKHLYHSYDVSPHAPTCCCVARLLSLTDDGCVLGQHLTSLLAAPDPDVVAATLQALVAFVRKTHVSSVRWHGNAGLNDRLLALSAGWGGKEEVRIALLLFVRGVWCTAAIHGNIPQATGNKLASGTCVQRLAGRGCLPTLLLLLRAAGPRPGGVHSGRRGRHPAGACCSA